MPEKKKTVPLVIMPAWNESETIGDTIREVRAHGPACDVLVVDDGSSDATAAIARAAGAIVVQLPFNLGVGGAMRTGFRYAKYHRYPRAIQVDADGQHDPRDIASVLGGLEEADIVIGARFAEKGDY
jgi:glycosyltransferase involved in cell wall biosynthesis